MHKRLEKKVNAFVYGMYYLAFPLSQREKLTLKYNKPGIISFHDKDHGDMTDNDLENWAQTILENHDITAADGEIILFCLPRIFGYVFNPVSFFLCLDKDKNIRAILAEVHNTFGEQHTYLCAYKDQRSITGQDTLRAKKLFHVSPFFTRDGYYTFRFDITADNFNVWIDYYDENDQKRLVTALNGNFEDLTKTSLRRAFWKYPLITVKAIVLIHWQALKIVTKGIRYVSKPEQRTEKVSRAGDLYKSKDL